MARAISRLPQIQRSNRAAIAVFFLLILVVVGLHPFSQKEMGGLTGEGDLLRQLAYVGLFAVIVLTLDLYQDLRNLVRLPISLLLLLAWCWISLSWSVAPMIGLRRLALTSMLIWMVFMSVGRAGFERTTHMMRAVLLITLALNYFAALLLPSGVHSGDLMDAGLAGDWRGILQQKNFAGAICVITILLLVFIRDNMKWNWRALFGAAAAYFLYRTASKTSIGFLGVALAVGWAYALLGPRYRPILIPLFAAAGVSVVYFGSDYLGGQYFPPDTLTGRVQIWPVLWSYARDHYWLGSGFGSFWNVGQASPVYQYTHGWVANIASGHNGYLDILVQLGMPGLALAAIALVAAPAWNLLVHPGIPSREGGFLTACLVFCVGQNLTESNLLDRDQFVQVLLMFVLALTVNLVQRKPRTAQRPSLQRRPALFQGPGALQHHAQ